MSLFSNNGEHKRRLDKARKEKEAIDFMRDMLLESGAPEELKIDLRIMKMADEVIDKIHTIKAIVFTNRSVDAYREKQIAFEYLSCVLGGVETFIQQHPACAKGRAYYDKEEE